MVSVWLTGLSELELGHGRAVVAWASCIQARGPAFHHEVEDAVGVAWLVDELLGGHARNRALAGPDHAVRKRKRPRALIVVGCYNIRRYSWGPRHELRAIDVILHRL